MNDMTPPTINVLPDARGNRLEGDAERFGRVVLGPIFAEFAHRLWLFQRFLPAQDDTCLLFCARGGLRLRLVYETFLASTGLEPPVPFADLMISRLIAARTAFAPAGAMPGAALIEELGREFKGQTMREMVSALTQQPAFALDDTWDQPFDGPIFFALLAQDLPEVAAIRATIARFDAAFRRHLDAVSGGRSTVLLCDTGLYGSTVRLLRDGVPTKRWAALQFARSNYKGFATPHFDITVGLSVERDGYAPWNARTVILRFWQLIESILEPDLESVKVFSDDAVPRSNLEIPGWQQRVGPDQDGLFSGLMAYLQDLVPGDLPLVGASADDGWRSLQRTILFPRRKDLAMLTLPPRGRDFGRSESIEQFPERASIKSSMWREGALVQRYPRLACIGLPLLEAIHCVRGLKRWARTRFSFIH